jgi:uncharacterized repeat protein (TIGR04138 family)
MPPEQDRLESPSRKTLDQFIREQGLYSCEAFEFVCRGLSFTVESVHGGIIDPKACRHISGQQLCEGLREFALAHWGMLAPLVLRRWNIRRTVDFGRIVFTLVDHGQMAKTQDDTLDDFRDLYDFAKAFGAEYRLDEKVIRKGIASCS